MRLEARSYITDEDAMAVSFSYVRYHQENFTDDDIPARSSTGDPGQECRVIHSRWGLYVLAHMILTVELNWNPLFPNDMMMSDISKSLMMTPQESA